MASPRKQTPKPILACARDLIKVLGRLTTLRCPWCDSRMLGAELVPHSGLRISCAGLALDGVTDHANDDGTCAYEYLTPLAFHEERSELISVSLSNPAPTFPTSPPSKQEPPSA